MLVASNEPPILSALGPYAPICDQMGVDFAFLGKLGLVGVQRKACADLVASLHDPRMFDFLTKGEELVAKVLLIEGDWAWDRTGQSRTCRGFTYAQLTGLRLSMQRKHGVIVVETLNLEHTAATLPQIEHWFEHEDKASSLLTVPKGPSWGDPKKATALRLLQCVPKVSLGMASRFYDALGFPVMLTVTDAEIAAVPGFGKARIKSLRETFNGSA